ncbi:nucleotidyltransferase family protein [Pelagibius marinus]|uniref:nucleotidyltransferase family protein n=1 Tax=Pelagibius marinus TaxID=2762760 RepID=UPI0018733234|nr:nucleotidyltransferase family protein [Pelagibius marinus]
MTHAPAASFTALVLAADRGPDDPVSQAAGVAHKCLAPVAGTAMLERVVTALAASAQVGRIAVSLRDTALLAQLPALAPLVAGGRLTALQAAGSPSRSVLQAATGLDRPFPLLVTTADHALLTTEMVDHFCAASRASGAEVTAGLTAAGVLLARYPQTRRTYLTFRDERYSGSNLFALMSPAARALPELWLRVEQQRKRPWRIAAVFGPRLLLGYLLRRFTLDQAMGRVSARLGVSVAAVKMPFAEAAIDVDKPEDLALVEEILAKA